MISTYIYTKQNQQFKPVQIWKISMEEDHKKKKAKKNMNKTK